MDNFAVEVVYATAGKQKIVTTMVAPGTSVLEAARNSGIDRDFPEINFDDQPMGIFGKKIPKPEKQEILPGQRIELYRPLLADPKQARASRAAKEKK